MDACTQNKIIQMDLSIRSATEIIFALFAVALFLRVPLLTMLFMLLLLIYVPVENKKIKYYFVASGFITFISAVNILKIPESDQLNYINALRDISALGLRDVIGFSSIGVSQTEPMFSIYLKMVSIIDSSGMLLMALSTFIIYGASSMAVKNIHSMIKLRSESYAYFYLISALFLFITFTLTSQLIRQYLAFSIFFSGLSFLLINRGMIGWWSMLLSILIHNSAGLLFIAIIITCVCLRISRRYGNLMLIFCSVIMGMAIRIMASKYGLDGAFRVEQGIPVSLMVIDAIIFVGFLLLSKRLMNENHRNHIMAFSFFILFVLIVLYPFPLLFMRYYFVIDFLRIFWGAVFLYIVYEKIRFLAPSLFVLAIAICLFTMRAHFSTWSYSLGFPGVYMANIYDLVDAQIDNYAIY